MKKKSKKIKTPELLIMRMLGYQITPNAFTTTKELVLFTLTLKSIANA